MARLQIEILNKRLIKPSNPTPNHLQKLKMSLFDQLAPKIYANIIYYYSAGGVDGDEIRANNITAQRCARLEKSLSEALVHFYPFAGRFMKDEVSIDCSDQGAEFWQARVSCKLSEFLQRGPEIELVDKLLPWEIPPAVDSATSPQLAIQVNAFDDGGIVVGVRISHILSDAATMSLLMKTWAAACRDGVNTNPIQIAGFHHEIAHAFPAKFSSLGFGFNHPIISAPPPCNEDNKIVTRRFLISSRLLTRIKHREASYIANAERQPSRVVVALALVWKSLMSMSMAKHGHLKDSALSIPMNLRGKVSLGKKKTHKAFGNFYVSILVSFVASKANNDVNLYDLITLLSSKIADTSAKIARASKDDLSTMLINFRRELNAKCHSTEGLDVYFCSSWYGALPVYETDFGWGKPIWASISTQPGPGVCLMDSCDGDGMELWVSLKQIEMITFKQQLYNFASMANL